MKSEDIAMKGHMRDEAERLYRMSFPIVERKSCISLRRMASDGTVDATAYTEGGELCGISYVMPRGDLLFVMYLAVDERSRGRGYGSMILDEIKRRYPGKTIFLTVEDPDEEGDDRGLRSRRVEFYERNDIHRTHSIVVWRGTRFEIMSADPGFDEDAYRRFWKGTRSEKVE